jgi:DNA-binding beta-propeller fold protein YncE
MTTQTAKGQVAVANRGSGNISILDVDTGNLINTVDLPSGEEEKPPEPLYVNNLISTNEIVVDDRANNRVVFFDQNTYEATGTVETGAGNFHLSVDPQEKELWVVNDLDDTLTVIDPQTKKPLGKATLPQELIGAGGKPHDVIIDPTGDYAYVSVIREDNTDSDLLVKIDTKNFQVVSSAEVGKDPHVSLAPETNLLYVPAQESNKVDIFDRRGTELVKVDTIEQPGAHGIDIGPLGRYLYTTNLPGGGANGLFAIDTRTNQIVGDLDGVDTPFPDPHNVALIGDGSKLFLTHSGANSSQVSFYSFPDPTLPVLDDSVNLDGLNPFGLAFVAPEQDALEVGTADNDFIQGAKGNDLLFGLDGDDEFEGGAGIDKLFGEKGNDLLWANDGNDVLLGGDGNDFLQGEQGNDILIGVSVESLFPGKDEIDTFTGGAGKDTFVLGDATLVYYDDDVANKSGRKDYAVIQDFNLGESDVIRLNGNADNYRIESRGTGEAVFWKSAGETDELIAIVEGNTSLDLASNAFEFTSI